MDGVFFLQNPRQMFIYFQYHGILVRYGRIYVLIQHIMLGYKTQSAQLVGLLCLKS